MHNGLDLVLDKIGRADPEKIVKVTGTFPEIKVVAPG
jgi:hypothetical protein